MQDTHTTYFLASNKASDFNECSWHSNLRTHNYAAQRAIHAALPNGKMAMTHLGRLVHLNQAAKQPLCAADEPVDHVAVLFLVVKHLLYVAPYLHSPAYVVRGVRNAPHGVVFACSRRSIQAIVSPCPKSWPILRQHPYGCLRFGKWVWRTTRHTCFTALTGCMYSAHELRMTPVNQTACIYHT